MRRLSILIITLSFGLSACGAKRDSALKADSTTLTEATQQGEMDAKLAEATTHWNKRVEKDQLLLSIAALEASVNMQTPGLDENARKVKIAETYEWLTRAYYLLADSHIRLEGDEDEMADQMMSVFEKGVTSAEKAIALRAPEFAAKVAADENAWKTDVGNCPPEAAPAIYWYSTNLGKWALLEGIATILARKDDIKASMDWIVKTNDQYFYAAPHRYFGAYHTKVPIGGGNPAAAKASFEKSVAGAPGYLATRVLMADSYAVLVGDRELYTTLLNEVISADPNAVPEIGPENILEQKKAKRLLSQADDKFY